MAHHAYYVTGDLEEGVQQSLSFVEQDLGLNPIGNPDVTVFRFPGFSVAEARRLISFEMQMPVRGEQKAIIIATSRLFHEAQNALLKLFEEPQEGTTLFLVIPSEGVLLPTLKSRLIKLPETEKHTNDRAHDFLALAGEERKKALEKIAVRSKSKEQNEKQAARQEALVLVQDLTRAVYERPVKKGDEHMKTSLLTDLTSFTEILHDRSAPLKLIFEHLLLVLPDHSSLPRAKV